MHALWSSALILGKISKFDATRCQTLWLKCTIFDFRCGSAPDSLRELTVLPQISWLCLRAPASKGRDRVLGGIGKDKGNGMRRTRGGKGRGGDLPDRCETASYAPVCAVGRFRPLMSLGPDGSKECVCLEIG